MSNGRKKIPTLSCDVR